jgi:integrase
MDVAATNACVEGLEDDFPVTAEHCMTCRRLAILDIVTVSKRLGHANPAITLKVYAHLFDQDDSAAADAINAAIGANSVPKNG